MLPLPSRTTKQSLHRTRRSVQETNPRTPIRRAHCSSDGFHRDPRLKDYQARPVGPNRETRHKLERYRRPRKAEKGDRRIDNLPCTKTRSLPTRLAARNTLLRTTRLWKDITRSGDRERDQRDVLLRRRCLPNVEMAWRIRKKCLSTVH